MTSGQMAPTSLIGQVTTTSPFGRKPEIHGFPIKVCELLSTLKGAVYVERVSMHDIKNIMNAKKAIKKAFKVQMAGLGFSIVEVLSTCPTNWGLDPVESLKWIQNNMIPQYQLGNFRGKDFRSGLPQNKLFLETFQTILRWDTAGELHHPMVKKWKAPLNCVGHGHAVTLRREKVVG